MEFTHKIVKNVAVLSSATSGWTKEINIVSWNNNEPVYDIRNWGPNHSRVGKGITLSAEEAALLRAALAGGTK